MPKTEIIRFIILRSIGNFLLLFSIFGVVATFGPSLYYEAQFRVAQARGVRYTIAEPQKSLLGEVLEKQRSSDQSSAIASQGFAQVLAGPKEQILIPKDTNFSIVIPKIGANARVFPNVDSLREDEFLPVLQKGVAHAKGTVFPGHKGNIYLFAHSTDNFWDVGRYNAVFYLLKDLVVGDDVAIFFENNRYNYKISETKIVDGNDVSSLINSQKQNEEILVLQTCWPPGTTWKRLLVLAKRK